MHSYSRRDFGKLVIAGVPLTLALGTQQLRAATDLRLGISTDSFRELPRLPGLDNVDDVLRAVKLSGIKEIELADGNVLPAGPNSGPAAPPPPAAYPKNAHIFTPEEIAYARAALRVTYREWRIETPDSTFRAIRQKIGAAGLTLHAYRVEFDDTFTDAEIEHTFAQATAMGAGIVSASVALPLAKRLAPFAERVHVLLSLENQADASKPGAVASLAQFDDALALSKSIRLKMDAGAVTAANGDSVAALKNFGSQITHVQITDRTRNGGKSHKLGDGDTPIAAVLAAVASRGDRMPIFIDYDYVGLGTAAEEVTRCLEYVRRVAG